MENISKLQKIPERLLKAENVVSIVINGERLDKKMIIEKAKNEARILLLNKEFFNEQGYEVLKEIERLRS